MKDRIFNIGSIVWHEVSEKVDIQPLQEVLNEQIDLAAYGTGIQQVYFTFIAVKPTNRRHQEEFTYSSSKKQLTVAVRLDYDAIAHASKHQALANMGSSFLEVLAPLKEYEVPNFDTPSFLEDLTKLLESGHWIRVAA